MPVETGWNSGDHLEMVHRLPFQLIHLAKNPVKLTVKTFLASLLSGIEATHFNMLPVVMPLFVASFTATLLLEQ